MDGKMKHLKYIIHSAQDTRKLQYRHSDNINYFFDALEVVRLPQIFLFETTDLYEKKNIPKVIYCIHALR